MTPRRRIEPPVPLDEIRVVEPGQIDVHDVAEALEGLFGGDWVWHKDAGKSGKSLWTQYHTVEGRVQVTGVVVLGESITGADLRRVPLGAIENAANLGVERAEDQTRAELSALPPLERTGQSSEQWSRLVAQHYTAWAKFVLNPAAAIAADLGVNRQTVNSWIREARLRGLLPPARRGKSADPAERAKQAERDAIAEIEDPETRAVAVDALRRVHAERDRQRDNRAG